MQPITIIKTGRLAAAHYPAGAKPAVSFTIQTPSLAGPIPQAVEMNYLRAR